MQISIYLKPLLISSASGAAIRKGTLLNPREISYEEISIAAQRRFFDRLAELCIDFICITPCLVICKNMEAPS
jgi:hypothetical protein